MHSSADSAPSTAGLQPGKSSDHCISGAGGISQLSLHIINSGYCPYSALHELFGVALLTFKMFL